MTLSREIKGQLRGKSPIYGTLCTRTLKGLLMNTFVTHTLKTPETLQPQRSVRLKLQQARFSFNNTSVSGPWMHTLEDVGLTKKRTPTAYLI